MNPNLDDPILSKRLALLTPREREVLDLILEGKISRQIGKQLEISLSTVKKYRGRIHRKLGQYGQRALGAFCPAKVADQTQPLLSKDSA